MISIIVPIYNAEKYIEKCIKSILKQSYKDFELILVDDGSTDRSGSICDEYSTFNNNIMVIHQMNSGVSNARNNGIMNAYGDYICFVDSDDWLPRDSLQILMNSIGNTDFCFGSVLYINPFRNTKRLEEPIFGSGEKIDNVLSIQKINPGPVAKLFKTSIIKANNILFNENIKFGEDTIFVFDYLSNCKRLSSTSKIVYCYNRLNENSASRKFYPKAGDWLAQSASAYDKVFDVKTDKVIKSICWHTCHDFDFACRTCSYLSDNETKRVFIISCFECFEKCFYKYDFVSFDLENLNFYKLIIQNKDVEALLKYINNKQSLGCAFKAFFRNLLRNIKLLVLYH